MRRLLSTMLVFAFACAPQDAGRELPSLDRDESIDPAAVLPQEGVAPGPTGPAPEAVPAEVDGDEELAGAFSALALVMAAMRTASAEAAEAASSPCAAGRASYAAAMEAAADTIAAHPLPGNRRPPAFTLASPTRYAELCEGLPLGLQRCARFDYKVANFNECETARLAVGDEERAAFEEMAHPGEEASEEAEAP